MAAGGESLPTDNDVIILGTGVAESILGAACARNSLSVLNLDQNDYYGSAWASQSLKALLEWCDSRIRTADVKTDNVKNFEDLKLEGDETVIPVTVKDHFLNVAYEWLIQDAATADVVKTDESSQQPQPVEASGDSDVVPEQHKTTDERKSSVWTKESILAQSHRFSIDLAPKVLLARGSMVEVLSKTRVGRYAEFKCVDRLLANEDGQLKQVPCSRSEVFQSSEISLVEKRMLMKFLTMCATYESDNNRQHWQAYESKSFSEFLANSALSLTPKLRRFIVSALALVPPSATTAEALASVREVLTSIGVYGNSPYLWMLYGSGDLPQHFSRLCAVNGGIYCLTKPVDGLIVDSERRCKGVVSEGQRLNCRFLISDSAYLREPVRSKSETLSSIARAVLITNATLLPDKEKEHISLLNYSGENENDSPTKILEVGVSGCAAPKDLFVVYVWAKSNGTPAKQQLLPLMQRLFSFDNELSAGDVSTKPRALWYLCYNQRTNDAIVEEVSPNIVATSPPDDSLTYAQMVPELRKQFLRWWPDVEFLPAESEIEESAAYGVSSEDNDQLAENTAADEEKPVSAVDSTPEQPTV